MITGAPGEPTQLAVTWGVSVTVKVALAVRFRTSVVVHDTVVVPIWNVAPDGGVQFANTGGGSHGVGSPHAEQLAGLLS